MCGGFLRKHASGLFDTRFGVTGTYGTKCCAHCSFERIHPLPTACELKDLYQSQYNFAGADTSRYSRWREIFLFSFLNRWWMGVDGDIGFHLRTGHGRLLDVGCNEGRGLRLFARNGFSVEGLELNEVAAAGARRSNLTVHTCPLEEFAPETSFDVAVLSNVLEHSLEPREMLDAVRRVLKPGGEVWISCPSGESWQRKFFGRNWINWHVPFHISHFSSRTLKRLLSDCGFTVTECSQVSCAQWMAQSWIAALFAKEGQKNKQLRNPILMATFMLMSRALLFPALWLGNYLGKGDALVVVAAKSEE
jgi:2-polyprenyl-3-methyl-5-hydroxy-6-metoxy-1,4-benzoquinol methylase